MTTIYYVEDDRDIAENVKTYLQIRQMEVHLFYSIADAKQALLRKCPDLLLIYKCRVSVPNSQLGLNPLIV